MYLQYFGLTQAPFSATPNTGLFLELTCSKSLFKELVLALNQPDGFVSVMGEAGVGKTTVRRKLLNSLYSHSSRYVVVDIPCPRMDAEGLFAALAQELRLPEIRGPELRVRIMETLRHLVDTGKRVSLVIDEGQTMPDQTLDALLELSTQQHGALMLVQVVMFSQPELGKTLNTHRQKSLKARLTASHALVPLDAGDVPYYVEERLRRAGYAGDSLFSSGALQLLWNASRGVPRIINVLAHKALLAAHAAGANSIEVAHVARAVADTAAAVQPARKANAGWLPRFRH